VHLHGAKPQNCVVQNFCTKGGQTLLSLLGTMEKNFSSHFKRYNLIFCAVNSCKTFSTCSSSSLRQDLLVKSAKNNLFFLFGLLELEMADLECFLKKRPQSFRN
jgi:hypothetical protein